MIQRELKHLLVGSHHAITLQLIVSTAPTYLIFYHLIGFEYHELYLHEENTL
jgi:hypothetical protein